MSSFAKKFDWQSAVQNEVCRRLIQLAGRSFGVHLNFVDHKGWLQGTPAGRFFNPANRLSALLAATDEGFKLKRDTAFQLAAEVAKIRLPKRNETPLGTALVGVPIIVAGEYVGYVYADDFFEFENLTQQRAKFASFLRRHLQNDPSLSEQIDDIPVLSASEVTHLVDILEIVTEAIAGDQPADIKIKNEKLSSPRIEIDGFVNSYIVGHSKQTRELVEMLARVAGSDATVLITGESGVGKELVAKTLHENSKRLRKEYVAVNCGAFHEHLLESELFGHVKGAFTGATDNRQGYFERAHGGTLFLDEIGETTLATQVKMLRFLQESTFMPVGSSKEKSSNVRVIAATNRDLKQMLKKARFREDLYYRLKVIQLTVPPLRERKEDIQVLVSHFLLKHAPDTGIIPKLGEKTLSIMLQYHWPGNIRQLENEVKRLCVLGRDDDLISEQHLSPEILQSAKKRKELYQIDDRLKKSLEEREKKLIIEGLKRNEGNKSKLARDLGMSRTVLANKIRKYAIEEEN